VILLSALHDLADRITGLHLGSDDDLCQPFSAQEVDARIRSVMRRTARQNTGGPLQAAITWPKVYDCGDLHLDFSRRQAYRARNIKRTSRLAHQQT